MMFKAKAEAEKKELQAQGMTAGEDFVDGKTLLISFRAQLRQKLTWRSPV